MESLSKYAGGPLALGALAISAWQLAPALGVTLTVLAVAWALAVLVAWRRDRMTLKQRAIHTANRVRRCMPQWWKLTDYAEHSAYGRDTDAHVHMHKLNERQRSWRSKLPRPRYPYTKRLHRRVTEVIEEMAREHAGSNQLKAYLARRPEPGEYETLARELWDNSRHIGVPPFAQVPHFSR